MTATAETAAGAFAARPGARANWPAPARCCASPCAATAY